jgi:hypothetical protein
MTTKALLLMIPLAFWITGCGGPERESKTATPAAPVAVTTVTAAEQPWPAIYEAAGTGRARMLALGPV